MQYYELAFKKHYFVVTPDEIRKLLDGFHHVITNTGVPKSYIESDPEIFFTTYSNLYSRLKNGEKLLWNKDYNIAYLTTGITHHLDNCVYQPGKHLSVPDFSEPCPRIETFCFTNWKGQLSTAFAVPQSPENICGLRLIFPSKVEYEIANGKHAQGIVLNTAFDDFDSYIGLLDNIRKLTNPLTVNWNGKIHRTTVRVSKNAKKDIENFYFMTSNGITII